MSDASDDECPPLALPLDIRPPQAGETAPADVVKADAPLPPVPVTLITGYLGAGKTTLVNFILSAKHGCRCAVLLNEIGDSADVERALVKEPQGGEAAPLGSWVELENGCICCSAKNDMVKALEALLQQRSKFDYIIIETTGLANPGPVAAALWTDEELESAVCLDAVVTVVDSKNILRQLADAPSPAEGGREGSGNGSGDGSAPSSEGVNEAQQQVAFADVILLNKMDLVSPQQLQHITRELGAINSDAAVLPCQRCEVDLRHILNTGIYSGSLRGPRVAAEAPEAGASDSLPGQLAGGEGAGSGSGSDGEACTACAARGDGPCERHGHSAAEAHSHQQHHHHAEGEACSICSAASGPGHQAGLAPSARVHTVSLVLREQALDLQRLRHWLDELLWEEERGEGQPDVFRVKALLWVVGSGHKHICQGVHDIYDVVEGPAWREGEARYSKLVFIGRRLDAAALEAKLRRCLAGAAEGGSS